MVWTITNSIDKKEIERRIKLVHSQMDLFKDDEQKE